MSEPKEFDWGKAADLPDKVVGVAEQEVMVSRAPDAYRSDQRFYRIIAWSLGAAVVLSVLGAVFLSFKGKEVPQVLIALGSASIGAIAGVLAGGKQ